MLSRILKFGSTVLALAMVLFLTACFGNVKEDRGNVGMEINTVKPQETKVAAEAGMDVDEILKGMTLEEKVGQLFMIHLENFGWSHTKLNPMMKKTIKDYHIGGVILFRHNMEEIEQTVRLVDELQAASAKIPLLVGIDQEGGAVTRLKWGTIMPGNMALGAAGSEELAQRVAAATGEELDALGINVNFAPVLDINNNPNNPVIGIRSFGENPELVSRLGKAYTAGLNQAGVAAAVKHFPGHGDTDVDSHLGLPSVPHTMERLREVELKPFQEAINYDVDMIMTAHITFPAVDDTKFISKRDGREISIPATLSYKTLTELLREKMGFKGVIITDALNMKAISDNFGGDEAVVMSLNAGADLFLMPPDFIKSYNGVMNGIKSGKIKQSRIDEAVRRIVALKIKRGIMDLTAGKKPSVDEKIANALRVVGGEKHRELEREAAEKAVTLIKNDDRLLPFKLDENKKIAVFAPTGEESNQARDSHAETGRALIIKNAIQEIAVEKGIKKVEIHGFSYGNSPELTQEQKAAIDNAHYVILATASSNASQMTPGRSNLPNFALDVVGYSEQKGKPLAVMAVTNPYDIAYMPQVKGYIAVYIGADGPNIPAGVRAVFGTINPNGRLPVSIPKLDGSGILYQAGSGLSYK